MGRTKFLDDRTHDAELNDVIEFLRRKIESGELVFTKERIHLGHLQYEGSDGTYSYRLYNYVYDLPGHWNIEIREKEKDCTVYSSKYDDLKDYDLLSVLFQKGFKEQEEKRTASQDQFSTVVQDYLDATE